MATRTQLRSRARSRADQGTAFPTDAQYNEYIDQATADVWRRLVGAGWKPQVTTVTITANGALTYNVGTDVHVILEVYRLEGGSYYPLKRIKDEYLTASRQETGAAYQYDLEGGAIAALTISFFPRPSTGTYVVRYVPRFPGFASDSDNWYGPDGSDELIILSAAIRGLQQEDGNVTDLTRELTKHWSEVLEQATWLDTRNPQIVRDVREPVRIDGADWNAMAVDW